ncbi:Ribosomal RNA small subunit methyltransferase B [Roseovarius albus]|uniref:Ribosomal RNA small subunit methyltransferase B n=1 Tax=Roseovarius albus TaxID=1247867 RepID=A0A1X6YYT5_9RHOB|nr:RsmB/NOP family class I SAM-dependent RNA methyltransferase [Roseovarius albus]SLN35347.1 Ribosomal RNA small subunit methyltransferase B [Roseovarius albus]
MTPAARVQTAIELLDEIQAGAPAEKVLTGWARRSRFAGSKDRAAIRDHVFDVLRQKNSAAQLGGGQSGRALMIGLLRLQGIDLETVFTGANYAPAALNDAETDAARVNPNRPSAIDLPDWIVPPMQAALGDEFGETARLLAQRAPVCLRVNLQKTGVSSAVSALADEGISARASALSPTALIVEEGARSVAGSGAYRDGWVELQDAASQSAMDLLPLEPDMRVLDYCAGGGGKTLAMAGRVKARYFAHDANAARLSDLPERAARAGVDVKIVTQQQLRSQTFDLVLCDVPCSGSGTWRRTPGAKWRFSPDDLAELIEVQAEILDKVAMLVRPGGNLVYATCSVLQSENEEQIAQFLQAQNDWRIVNQKRWPVQADGDGFFCAILQKITKFEAF